jgi:IS5 family transposase
VSRTAERQVSFADWELVRQGLRLEPLLQAISDFLENQKDMIEQVRCDLTRGLKNAETGRSGLTALAGSDAHQELELSRIT